MTETPMKVEVLCLKCSERDPEEKENYVAGRLYDIEMKPIGPLALNIEHKIQTQKYSCPNCNTHISISIYPPTFLAPQH